MKHHHNYNRNIFKSDWGNLDGLGFLRGLNEWQIDDGGGAPLSAKGALALKGKSNFYCIINTFWENITAQPAI